MPISPTVEYVESFIVVGLQVRTQNSDEFNEKTAKIPNLWQQFYASGLAANTPIFGVYSNYDSDASGYYTVTVGVASEHVQAQWSSVKIQAGNYLVFHGIGLMPATVIETWKRIWEFFETNTQYQRNFVSDFEVYDGAEQVAIYIGLALIA
jgi:predicted transcriptional regulator YdeE